MKKYDYVSLKAAQVTLRNAAERKGSWWRMFARYAEIAKRKIWYIEIGLLACLILIVAGCTSSASLGVSSSVYYPKKWESPASRRQFTQPTVDIGRNNLPMVRRAK